MPLSNLTIKNFRSSFQLTDQTNYQVSDYLETHGFGTFSSGGFFPLLGTNEFYDWFTSNTLPRTVLITIEPSPHNTAVIDSNFIPHFDGDYTGLGVGYWSFGTNDLSIGAVAEGEVAGPIQIHQMAGTSKSDWLNHSDITHPNHPTYWTSASCPLHATEYDPGGGAHGNAPISEQDLGIGHDFWKYVLQGEFNGEPYEPTAGQPQTYYKHFQASLKTNLSGFVWDDPVYDVIAVNSMPLNNDGTAQEGNKVYCIVKLGTNVSGQDIVDLHEHWGNYIRVNFNGSPTFVQHSNSNSDSITIVDNNEVWNEEDIPDYGGSAEDTEGYNDVIDDTTETDNGNIGGEGDPGTALDGEEATGQIIVEFTDSGTDGDSDLSSDIDDYDDTSADTSASDQDGDGVSDSDDDDFEGGDLAADGLLDVPLDNPNVGDGDLEESEPNATDYDSVASTQDSAQNEDINATEDAAGSGTQAGDIASHW